MSSAPSSPSSGRRKSSLMTYYTGIKSKLGNEWTSELYFDPEADEKSGLCYKIGQERLITDLWPYFFDNNNENIKRVTVYKHPLFSWQLSDYLLYHNFVLLETNKWYWTIEKNSEGITIQRSKQPMAVKDRYRQQDRDTRISEVIDDSGRINLGNLITRLKQTNELGKRYHYVTSNCQHFAEAVFKIVAKSKKYPEPLLTRVVFSVFTYLYLFIVGLYYLLKFW